MRILLLAVALLLAPVPHAAANEAPIAIASFPSEARVGEPIVLTSLSYDPDGEIASTTWEFSDDGRTKSGASVTKAFGWPGLHGVILRVTDDSGAQAQLELRVLVRAPLMHGRAYAALALGETAADTGEVSTTQQDETLATVAEYRSGGLRVSGLDGQVNTYQGRAVARASVGLARIPNPFGYLLVTGVETLSIVGCGEPPLTWARFGQVRLNDAVLVAGEVPPNTRVDVPGAGTLELNIVETIGDRASVVAIRFTALDGEITELAHAEAGVSHCPYA